MLKYKSIENKSFHFSLTHLDVSQVSLKIFNRARKKPCEYKSIVVETSCNCIALTGALVKRRGRNEMREKRKRNRYKGRGRSIGRRKIEKRDWPYRWSNSKEMASSVRARSQNSSSFQNSKDFRGFREMLPAGLVSRLCVCQHHQQ